ncbi:MAG: LysR family transcriptional regulator [Lachnospiraceae bacterium]|nr:LysR family transcriptional regulator [Lachnospiraceae bacterium]
MNTKQIDYILELSQTKNFNHAAENLYISQPTMTYQIKLVEDEIGFQIFERSGKGASLTPAGEQFCVTLKNIKNELNRAIEQGQNFSSVYQDNVNIGLPMRSAIHLLPEAITKFSEKNPSRRFIRKDPNGWRRFPTCSACCPESADCKWKHSLFQQS